LNVSLRPAGEDDRLFIKTVYFGTHRWVIEQLFGWRGDDFEQAKLYEHLDLKATSIIMVDGSDAGFLMVRRETEAIYLEQIYLESPWQSRGIGSLLVRQLIEEARSRKVPLRLSTAKINPARRLYERLGLVVVSESQYKVEMEC
jgi:GNAT superfamily N-acetyltransferase